MGMPIRELLKRFDGRELSDWQAYYAIEPWGWEQDNLRIGTLATQLSIAHGGDAEDPRQWFTDELPKYPSDPPPDDVEE